MKKLLLALAIIGLAACSSGTKEPKIKVIDETPVEISFGEKQISYRTRVCEVIKVTNADGSEYKDCEAVFFANPIDTEAPGEKTLDLIYKDDATKTNATATVKVVVLEAENEEE